jgi:DNA helicase-2/ATP-dependent DNA helicase PcrA
MNYREDQRSIMEYDGGTMAVGAVPGAGKTFIVANLVAKLIEEKKHLPGKVLIVTYMNSAVTNFKNRIGSILKEKNVGTKRDFEVMTIHSLAYKILREKPDVVGVKEDFEILDEDKKKFFINEALNKWLKNQGETIFKSLLKSPKNQVQYDRWKGEFINISGGIISKLKLMDMKPRDFNEKIVGNYDPLLKALGIIYEEYDKSLKVHGFIDYDDILNMAYKIIKKDRDARKKFQKKYTYIFEDECQDSNLIQCKLLKLLSKDNDNLVRVGDLNQSINGTFSASEPKLFKEFMDEASKSYLMDRASRSSKDVIGVANYLVDYVTNEHPTSECRHALIDQRIKTVNKGPWGENPITEKYGVHAYELESDKSEIIKTLKLIKAFKKKNDNKSIGVLLPSNDAVKKLGELLKREGIEYEDLSSMSEEKFKVVNLAIGVINFIDRPYDKRNLIHLLSLMETEGWESLESLDIHSILEEIDGESRNIILDILNIRDLSYENILIKIIDIFNLKVEESSLIESIISYIQVFTMINKKATLGDIGQNLKDNKRVFLSMVEVVSDIIGYEPRKDKVTICTYHKSKGLEWDLVFLLNLTKYNFPSRFTDSIRSECWYLKSTYANPNAVLNSLVDKLIGKRIEGNYSINAKIDVINERIRLLYVGITRAKEHLIIMSNRLNSKINKKQVSSEYFNILRDYVIKEEESC